MSLLTVEGLTKRYGDTVVLENLSFQVQPGEAVGVVGPNGVGKSTLLRLLAGELPADAGSVSLGPGATVGYLPQAMEPPAGQTLAEMVQTARGDLDEIEASLRAIERAMAHASSPDLPSLLDDYAQLSEAFETRGGYLRHESDAVLAGLGLGAIDPQRPVATLSGGEKARLNLAALLLNHPDLMLLDEPTNHLDFAALEWLETFLAASRCALLVVSHDRRFLDKTVSRVLEIDEAKHNGQIFTGGYSAYADEKVRQRASAAAAWAAQQEEIRDLRRIVRSKGRQVAHNRPPTDSDGFVYAFKGSRVDSTIARNVRAAEERLSRIEADPLPKPPRPLTANTQFDPAAFGSKQPLHAEGLTVRFGAQVLFADLACSVGPRTRAVIVGPNGAGKSTLLRLLAGIQSPDAGRVYRAPGVVIGYLEQEQTLLDGSQTVFEAYAQGLVGDFETLKADLLALGLFTWPDLLRPVGALSVGQKRKLQVARLLVLRANVLLLDEPTNHISLDVLENLEDALAGFAGPIVAVSHDRRFIERFGDEIWELDQGRLRRHLGWDAFTAARRAAAT